MSGAGAATDRARARALARLRAPGALLACAKKGFGVFAHGDRRERPVARLSEAQVRALLADGALEAIHDGYRLTAAGYALARRLQARPEEAFAGQHAPIVDRHVIEPGGEIRITRGVDAAAFQRWLERVSGSAGGRFFTAAEVDAALRLHADWEAGQVGLVRGSDWTAAPQSGGARGPGGGREGALAAGLDARSRVDTALASLAAPLRRVVVALCLEERGFEALERIENWPARSAKIALKLALAQLAQRSS